MAQYEFLREFKRADHNDAGLNLEGELFLHWRGEVRGTSTSRATIGPFRVRHSDRASSTLVRARAAEVSRYAIETSYSSTSTSISQMYWSVQLQTNI